MAGLKITEKLSATNTETSASDILKSVQSNLKDVNKHGAISLAMQHPNADMLSVGTVCEYKSGKLFHLAVQTVSKEGVSYIKKRNDISNEIIFGFGSLKVIQACADRFTLGDVDSIVKNPNFSKLIDFVVEKVTALASNNLKALITILENDTIFENASNDDQRNCLHQLMDTAASLFQSLVDKRTPQVFPITMPATDTL